MNQPYYDYWAMTTSQLPNSQTQYQQHCDWLHQQQHHEINQAMTPITLNTSYYDLNNTTLKSSDSESSSTSYNSISSNEPCKNEGTSKIKIFKWMQIKRTPANYNGRKYPWAQNSGF
jgi:hypothetical protein